MSRPASFAASLDQSSQVLRYYRLHSRIYDITRWSFLFGRHRLIELVAKQGTPTNILEVGCGTGKNLENLHRTFPEARITGLDMSEAMLRVAHKKLGGLQRVALLHMPYTYPLQSAEPYDLIVFSYVLSMINPGWDKAIEHALADLAAGGLVAAVDFHDAGGSLYRRWMASQHVHMQGHLLPQFLSCFRTRACTIRSAYFGVWKYFLYVGEK